MKFPKITQEKNQYRENNGNTSFAFHWAATDLDNLLPDERERYLDQVAQCFINNKATENLKGFDFFKIYKVSNQIFLNTTHENLQIPGVTLSPCLKLEKSLFGSENYESNILIKADFAKINGHYYRFFRITEFPHELFDTDTANFIAAFRKIPKEKSIRALDRKRRLFRSDNTSAFANYTSEKAESQSEDLLSKIQLGSDALYELEFWFFAITTTEDELEAETRVILSALKSEDCKVCIEDLGLTEALLNFIPGVTPNFLNAALPPLSYLVGLLPLSTDKVHDEGLKLTALSGHNVNWDNFAADSLNFNVAVCGTSGVGKTFLVQKMVDEFLKQGKKALIIDRGDSFLRLAKYHNGHIMNGKINPLQFKDNITFLTEFFASFIPQEEFSFKARCVLYKSLCQIMETTPPKGTWELLKLLENDLPEFTLYFEELKKYFTDEILPITDITYVDTKEYPERFLRPLFIFLTEYIKKIEGRKLFVFEEAWHELDNNITYLSEFFRTARTQGISCVAITQMFDDLVENKIGKVIAQMTCYKFFFSQQIKKSEYLDDYDVEQIHSCQSEKGKFSEFYLKSPLHRKKLRLYATPLEHEKYTSNDRDKEALKKYLADKEEYFDFKTLIHRWTEIKYGQDNIHTPIIDLPPIASLNSIHAR